MAITAQQVNSIRHGLDKLRPAFHPSREQGTEHQADDTGTRPALERMKKRGFELPEIIIRLSEKGIEVKAQTLAKYLAEARRQKDASESKVRAVSPRRWSP